MHKKLHDLYPLPKVFSGEYSDETAAHLARTAEKRYAWRILVRKPKTKKNYFQT